jgi:hypothetical protein
MVPIKLFDPGATTATIKEWILSGVLDYGNVWFWKIHSTIDG